VVDLWLAVALRRAGAPWRTAAAAVLLMVLAFVIFLGVTQPANRATANWTQAVPEWQALRARWEWSHAANAVVVFAALACIGRAAIGGRRRP